MLCMCSPSDTKRTAEVLSKEFGDLAVVQSSDILIEINPKGVSNRYSNTVRFRSFLFPCGIAFITRRRQPYG